MAKTTPSRRAKSKTKAPKKPTQLDRIEKKLDTIHRTVVVRADSIHATLVDTKRSIGSIESKLSTLNAWEMLNEAMSEAKLASPTVAVEEKWVPKVGEWAVCLKLQNQISGIEVGEAYKVQEGGVEGKVCVIDADGDPRWWEPEHFRPATPEEIAAHEAKAEAQAAEDAKLVFGARVEVKGRENEIWKIGCDEPTDEGYWRLCPSKCGNLNTMTAKRHQFTLLP